MGVEIMSMQGSLKTRDEFLDGKRDYSPYLVHLTKDAVNEEGYLDADAQDALDSILEQKILYACNHFFPYSKNLNNQKPSVIDKFRVVCFTETPIDQIGVILYKSIKRKFNPEPYGLVFTKEYIREKGGNPVFYVALKTAKPLWQYLYQPHIEGKEEVPDNICKLLALVTECQKGNDWHWEREWRIVGNLEFKLSEVFCGLCPDNEIAYFENKYPPIKFISPTWDYKRILAKGVGK
jgi:hypothetical protein